jgi:tetratricopeptide (TPR) repeat protein
MAALRRDALTALALAALTAAVFSRTAGWGFVNFDDPVYAESNRHVLTGLAAANARWAFTTFDAANWHPLTWLSLQADAALFGVRPWSFHRTNVLLHAANAALVFLALRALTGAFWRSAVVALLFAVHPLRVESVAWVSERKDVLSACFGLLALWAYAGYARSPSAGRYLAVAGALALSLLAKPMLVTLPCLLLVLDWWPLRRAGSRRRLAAEKLPLLALCAASCVVTLVAQDRGGAVRSLEAVPVTGRLVTALVAYATYPAMALWPVGLAPYYPYPADGWPAVRVAVSVLAVAGLTALAVGQRRRRPYLLAAWLWYLGTLVPVIGLVQVGNQAYADRYTYFPLIGVVLAAVWAAADWTPAPRARWSGVTVAGLALVLGVLTWRQSEIWRDGLALWEHTLAVTGPNALAESNYGKVLEDRVPGRAKEAMRHFARAVEISPGYAQGHFNLGQALEKEGRTAEAVRHYRLALNADPLLADAHNNLGAALGRGGATADAERHYREAVRADPELAIARVNLGALLESRGEDDEAITHYREALRIDPADGEAHGRLGVALAKRGDLAGAAEHFRRAAELRPRSATPQRNLGLALEKLGRLAEAVACFRRVAELEPGDLDNRLRLAGALTRLGESGAARAQYAEALRIEPGWPARLIREARELATAPDPRARDGAGAVEKAGHACDAVRPTPAPFLDTLAAAYAEAGRFAEAAAAAEKAAAAADAAGRPDLARVIAGRLALYRERRPFHEPAPADTR